MFPKNARPLFNVIATDDFSFSVAQFGGDRFLAFKAEFPVEFQPYTKTGDTDLDWATLTGTQQ